MRTVLALFALILAACSAQEPASLSPLAQQGRGIYMNVCIACHNANPNRDGAIGPANAGASAALLEAKIVRGEYPAGYTPKRPNSQTMPLFPYLKEKIPALTAFLAEVEKPAE